MLLIPKFLRPNHSFRLLLYLEWVLLGIALLTAFSPLPHNRSLVWGSPFDFSLGRYSTLGVVLSILALGLMGLRLPVNRSGLSQILYTGLGFGLSWLAVFSGGRGGGFFPALLLMVVIRACILFPWSGACWLPA